MFKLINQIFDAKFTFKTHDEAREFFLMLQNRLKNINFMVFKRDDYRHAMAEVENIIKDRVEAV